MKDPTLLRCVEDLITKTVVLSEKARTDSNLALEAQMDCALKALVALADAILKNNPVFGIEPWHPIHEDVPLESPGEMLLRLKDAKGRPLPPYPVIMAFYENGLTAEIDKVLFLCALREFETGGERQISINISARSLRDGEFVKTVLTRLEKIEIGPKDKIIAEIHESRPHLNMRLKVLKLLRGAGLCFAIDDVGLSMNDVMRLSDFSSIADFIKIDRHSVCSHSERPHSLDHVVSVIHSILPQTVMIAEGVKSPTHARELHAWHPAIRYVQGMHLPSRDAFARDWTENARQG